MSLKIVKCNNCSSQDFRIEEIIYYKAALSENGNMETYKDAGSGINKIFCQKCGAEYSENDFNSINF